MNVAAFVRRVYGVCTTCVRRVVESPHVELPHVPHQRTKRIALPLPRDCLTRSLRGASGIVTGPCVGGDARGLVSGSHGVTFAPQFKRNSSEILRVYVLWDFLRAPYVANPAILPTVRSSQILRFGFLGQRACHRHVTMCVFSINIKLKCW